MIGGFDIALQETVDSQDVDLLLRSALAAWPEGVVESADGSVVTTLGDALRRSWPSELFIYETRDAYDSWTLNGLTERYANGMMAITVEEDCLSFVVSDDAGPAHELVVDMISAIKNNRGVVRKPKAA